MTCPQCGKANPEGAKFCLECGTTLADPPRQEREERKVVCVVFADLVGFTSQAERMDPEGLAFTFDSEGQEVFQKNLYAVRDGTMFTVQFLAASSEDAALLDDILTTWGWTLPPLAP